MVAEFACVLAPNIDLNVVGQPQGEVFQSLWARSTINTEADFVDIIDVRTPWSPS